MIYDMNIWFCTFTDNYPTIILLSSIGYACHLQDCNWAAYAYIGSYDQYYQGAYYSHAGVQLHEHGHNMQLAHSGGLDGLEYTGKIVLCRSAQDVFERTFGYLMSNTSSSLFHSDHSCSMGNPLYGDELGIMCFNAAKNWYASLSYLET